MMILDCTLRDGGYYTNWDFDRPLVDLYLESFNLLPVDYLEIGYRSKFLDNYLGEYFYCPPYVLERVRRLSNKKIAVMLNEKDTEPEVLDEVLSPCNGFIDLVRLAVNPVNFARALKLAGMIKDRGFQVGFNLMYMSTWKNDEGTLSLMPDVEGKVDYLNLVDSYGGIYPDEVRQTIEAVKNRTNVKIGFHGHNNLELGLINALTAVECGAEIVDATVTGMGRGAGNLKTELLLTALNRKAGLSVDFSALGNIVNAFQELQKEFQWGTNLPYMISGANSLPQKDVMNWVTARFYSFNSIIRALQNQKIGIEDNQKLKLFKPQNEFSKAVIIGGGPNANIHSTAVKEFIQRESDICVIHASSKNASNYKDLNLQQYFCLVGNEGHRLEKIFDDLGTFDGYCVLPPFPRKMGTYIPQAVKNKCFELASVEFIEKLNDTHTVIALQTAISLGVKNVFLVGYDGYNSSVISNMEQQLFSENELIFSKARKVLDIVSLVPTQYSIPITSVYSLLFR